MIVHDIFFKRLIKKNALLTSKERRRHWQTDILLKKKHLVNTHTHISYKLIDWINQFKRKFQWKYGIFMIITYCPFIRSLIQNRVIFCITINIYNEKLIYDIIAHISKHKTFRTADTVSNESNANFFYELLKMLHLILIYSKKVLSHLIKACALMCVYTNG